MTSITLDYTPTPRQAAFHASTADEVLYGGAAGGGKSKAVRMEATVRALEVPGSRQLIIRKTYGEVDRDIARPLVEEVPPELGTYNVASHEFRFHNGSIIDLGYMDTDSDATRYQGGEWVTIFIDEATQHTPYRLNYLRSRLRASGPILDRMRALGRTPGMRYTANPGGPGHAWIKARFIDPAPPGTIFRMPATTEQPNPRTRVYIPARVTDNPHIGVEYRAALEELPTDERRALLDGDWDVYAGMRFGDWRRDVHVWPWEAISELVRPGVPYARAVGVDYGLDAPFAALWGVKAGDGLVIVYREAYQAGLTPAAQAALIRDLEPEGEVDYPSGRVAPIVVDPSTWARNPNQPARQPRSVGEMDADTPPPGSIADTYRRTLGGRVVKARNDRLASVALVADKLRVRPDGLPRLVVAESCTNLIRTLPALPRDRRRPEDVDTKAEDHAYDALRYLLMQLEGQPQRAGGAAPSARVGVGDLGAGVFTVPAGDAAALRGF